MALQLPAGAHETDGRMTFGFDPALAGSPASTAFAHVPAVSVSSSPCRWPALSMYSPPMAQLPADPHDTDSRKAAGFALAFAGTPASTPVAHVPAVSASSSPCELPE